MLRKAFLFLIVPILLLSPAAARAQTGAQAITIDTLQIDLWPDYDRPEVLVIYRFSLASTTNLPAQLTLRIPVASGGPYNLAYQDQVDTGETSLFNLEFTTTEEGEWILVSFTAPTPNLQLEFYDPGIQRESDRSAYSFTWPADYTVRSMTVHVQQPRTASDMRIEPAMGEGETLQDGLTYFTGVLGEVEAGEQFGLQLSYLKTDDTLSQSFDPVFPAEPAPTRTTFPNVWPWILGGLGLAMVVGVVIWYLAPQRRQPPAPRKRHSSATPNRAVNEPAGVFCHNCGTRSQAGDAFCRSCGVKLRQ